MPCEQPSANAATMVLILRSVLIESGDITLVCGDEFVSTHIVYSLTSKV